MARESVLSLEIRDTFERKYRCVTFKHHGSPYSPIGHPDIYGFTEEGMAFFLETKKPGEKPTPVQLNRIALINRKGGHAGWVDNLADAEVFIQRLIGRELYTGLAS